MRRRTQLYDLLGIPADADEVSLRRAYNQQRERREREAADPRVDEDLRELRAAYEVLSDAARRALYDEFGEVALEPGFDPDAARREIERRKEQARRMARAALLSPTAVPHVEPGEGGAPAKRHWEIEVAVGPRMSKSGGVLKIDVTRPERCPRCDGNGCGERTCTNCRGQRKVITRRIEPCAPCHGVGLFGEPVNCGSCKGTGRRGSRNCSRCGALGVVLERRTCRQCGGRGFHILHVEVPCPLCRETGLVPCKLCHGRGTVPRTRPLRVRVPPGARDGVLYRYAGAGFAVLDPTPGDLYVRYKVLAKAPRRR